MGSPVSTTITPGHVGRSPHPRVTVCVAHDVHVRGRHELALPDDRRLAQPVLGLAGGDVRRRPQLDDHRRPRERHVTFDDERAARSGSRTRMVGGARSGPRPVREPGDSSRRLAEPALVHIRNEGGADPVDGVLAEIVTDTESIDACGECLHRGALDADRLGHRLHLQRIRHDDAVEAELVAEQALDQRRVDGGGQIVDADMRRHDRLHSRGDRGPERLEPRLEVADELRQLEMRVLRGRAVARPVLRAGGDAPTLEPANPRADMPRNEVRIRAERARPDHRVRRDVHIGDGCEVPVHADGGELCGDRCRDALRQGRDHRRRRAPHRPGRSCLCPTRVS